MFIVRRLVRRSLLVLHSIGEGGNAGGLSFKFSEDVPVCAAGAAANRVS